VTPDGLQPSGPPLTIDLESETNARAFIRVMEFPYTVDGIYRLTCEVLSGDAWMPANQYLLPVKLIVTS
jgi:hypothetical protein